MQLPASQASRLRPSWTLPVIVLVLAGCAGWAANPFRGATPDVLEVSIKNQGLQDVRVRLMSALGSRQLGVVGGNTDHDVHLHWERSEKVSFRLDPLVGASYTTEEILTSPGDHIELIIPMELVHTVLRRR